MLSRRKLGKAAAMGSFGALGGLPPRRPDQMHDTPGPAVGAGPRSIGPQPFVVIFGTGKNRGLFIYSPVPGAGNLILSAVPAAGTDKFGNPVTKGLELHGAATLFSMTTEDANEAAAGTVLVGVAGVGPSRQLITEIFSPTLTGSGTSAVLALAGGSEDITIAPYAALGQPLKVSRVDVSPAGFAPPARANGSEPWNAMTPLQNSWSNGAAVAAQYRFVASPPATVEIIGDITHASVSGSSIFFTLPAAYRPANIQSAALSFYACTAGFANAANPPRVTVAANGNVSGDSLPAGTTEISFHALISLDA